MNAPLPVQITQQIAKLREGWMFVGAAFQRGSVHCEECHYCEHKGQMVGFDEGRGYEAWMECSLGRRAGDRPEQCPAYAEHLADLREVE